MRYHWISLLVLGTTLAVVSGCAKPTRSPQDDSVIPAFSMKSAPKQKQQANHIRINAIRDTALSIGAQGALAWRSHDINHYLEAQKQYLDKIYNFRSLILDDNILPPVLEEAERILHQDNPSALRLADKTYQIEAPPRFVTAAPIWQDYLLMHYKKPETPHQSLLPNTVEERTVWNKYLQKGWERGLQQAFLIYKTNLARLQRDFEGMILYRKLLAQNMVTAPFVSKAELGVTGDETKIRINDRVLRIAATSKLHTNVDEWNAVITLDERNQRIK